MVEIRKDDRTLTVPYPSYLVDYKPYGWQIVGTAYTTPVVKAKPIKNINAESTNSTEKAEKPAKVDYNSLGYNKIKKIAAEKGLLESLPDMKQKTIIEALENAETK
jgi:hypothetical protein